MKQITLIQKDNLKIGGMP
ncbi:hypothetical protein Gotri_022780 [Gossypium trilobum]|uniref:Uncharacterized protein n=1 Tax=Gossypium trilobum TaxID=34281 RepID=A0A7J9DGY8_9ROSI|nr:hypothetical protein [Gossypium trilobum]